MGNEWKRHGETDVYYTRQVGEVWLEVFEFRYELPTEGRAYGGHVHMPGIKPGDFDPEISAWFWCGKDIGDTPYKTPEAAQRSLVRMLQRRVDRLAVAIAHATK